MVLSSCPPIADHVTMNSPPNYRRYRFPAQIISHTVWLYYRFTSSLRDVEDLLAERNVIVSYESIRQWRNHFGPEYARTLKKRSGRLGDNWHL
jgi:putative transposase